MWPTNFYEYCNERNLKKNPKHLVIFLHGYGANGENLINLGHEFDYVLPNAYYVAPNAIQPWEGGFPHSYQWFSLQNGLSRASLTDLSQEILNSNKILTDFIERQLHRFDLSYKDLIIAGFSQGGMMSLYQGLSLPEVPAGVISFSGKLVTPEMIGQKTIVKPKICLIHGESDSVVPFENFTTAKEILEQQKVDFHSYSFPNLDHTIDIHAVRAAQEFLKKIL